MAGLFSFLPFIIVKHIDYADYAPQNKRSHKPPNNDYRLFHVTSPHILLPQ